jgi:hypothetical protein
MIPSLAYTRAGEAVTSLEEHKGLIRGVVVTGQRPDGEPLLATRYWYPDGRMTPARATEHDLEIG